MLLDPLSNKARWPNYFRYGYRDISVVLEDLLQARESGYVTVTVFIGIHRILDRVIKNKLNSRKEIGCRDTFDEKFISVN